MNHRAKKLIRDMISACELIGQFIEGKSLEDFFDDPLLRSAVERQFMILGEALSVLHRIDQAEAEAVPSHQKIIGMRNLLVHGYSIVDAEVVWAAANFNVPALIRILRARVE